MAAVEQYGAHKVAAITFTKSAADELRMRAGAALGLGRNLEILRKRLPYVGTIHSVAYRALGNPKLVDKRDWKEFADYAALPGEIEDVGSPDDVDGYWTPEDLDGSSPGIGMLLKIVSAAKHRGDPIGTVAAELVPPNKQALWRPEYFEVLASRYASWKRDKGLLDFDDLLEAGKEITLPVSVLLDDEAQDQSKLMWEVVDAWAKDTETSIFCGDPYQAIFCFAGGRPELFLNHPGEWRRLGKSHRLDDESAAYSYSVLELAGWHLGNPPVRGLGGFPRDGTTMYLARINKLVKEFANQLMLDGEPFTALSGWSPWRSIAADAYRTLAKLREGGVVQSGELLTVVKAAASGVINRLHKTEIERLARQDVPVTVDEIRDKLNLDHFQYQHWDVEGYMKRVQEKYGFRGLFGKPKTTVSTIHKAKGREADRVVLLSDWGGLPGRIANSGGEGARLEGCAAYVAVTRHRHELTIVGTGATSQYPFPSRPGGS